ncbi:hypothetical protein FC756_01060 [Lysinibacillus mangiferihumi]|uniref:Uncharacterized protein n=1 Tax=Lysinibacillus mangiferihumi TaxID=1130819 RepID=A0A4U2ZGV8_9BACI|nr:hypothetical protein [Lysinibacillus mangiferihumi]TKI72681.1 hypothetical protein FC756_01060 [Lysinibacillus mangiferihumi]
MLADIIFESNFTYFEKGVLLEAIYDINEVFKDFDSYLEKHLKESNLKLIIRQVPIHGGMDSAYTFIHKSIIYLFIFNSALDGSSGRFNDISNYLKGTFVHEMGHVYDAALNFQASEILFEKTGSYYLENKQGISYYPVGDSGNDTGTTEYGAENHFDDFAEVFSTKVYGEKYDINQGRLVSKGRLRYIEEIYNCLSVWRGSNDKG